eukprot:jgi/Botrbrau1/16271/Bobra.0066s0052.1
MVHTTPTMESLNVPDREGESVLGIPIDRSDGQPAWNHGTLSEQQFQPQVFPGVPSVDLQTFIPGAYQEQVQLPVDCLPEEHHPPVTTKSSQYRGVYKRKRGGRWEASIVIDGKNCRLGLHDTEVLAAHAYDAVAIKRWGVEEAQNKLNFQSSMYNLAALNQLTLPQVVEVVRGNTARGRKAAQLPPESAAAPSAAVAIDEAEPASKPRPLTGQKRSTPDSQPHSRPKDGGLLLTPQTSPVPPAQLRGPDTPLGHPAVPSAITSTGQAPGGAAQAAPVFCMAGQPLLFPVQQQSLGSQAPSRAGQPLLALDPNLVWAGPASTVPGQVQGLGMAGQATTVPGQVQGLGMAGQATTLAGQVQGVGLAGQDPRLPDQASGVMKFLMSTAAAPPPPADAASGAAVPCSGGDRVVCKQSSKYRGVSTHKQSGKWVSQIKAGGKQIYLGFYKDQLTAAQAYDQAAINVQGEKAETNFPLVTYSDRWDYLRSISLHELVLQLKKGPRGPGEIKQIKVPQSSFRGVAPDKSKKWRAQITTGAKHTVYLGLYPTEVAAARAYDRASLAKRGVQSKTNFPAEDYAAELDHLTSAPFSDIVKELRASAQGTGAAEDDLLPASEYDLFVDQLGLSTSDGPDPPLAVPQGTSLVRNSLEGPLPMPGSHQAYGAALASGPPAFYHGQPSPTDPGSNPGALGIASGSMISDPQNNPACHQQGMNVPNYQSLPVAVPHGYPMAAMPPGLLVQVRSPGDPSHCALRGRALVPSARDAIDPSVRPGGFSGQVAGPGTLPQGTSGVHRAHVPALPCDSFALGPPAETSSISSASPALINPLAGAHIHPRAQAPGSAMVSSAMSVQQQAPWLVEGPGDSRFDVDDPCGLASRDQTPMFHAQMGGDSYQQFLLPQDCFAPASGGRLPHQPLDGALPGGAGAGALTDEALFSALPGEAVLGVLHEQAGPATTPGQGLQLAMPDQADLRTSPGAVPGPTPTVPMLPGAAAYGGRGTPFGSHEGVAPGAETGQPQTPTAETVSAPGVAQAHDGAYYTDLVMLGSGGEDTGAGSVKGEAEGPNSEVALLGYGFAEELAGACGPARKLPEVLFPGEDPQFCSSPSAPELLHLNRSERDLPGALLLEERQGSPLESFRSTPGGAAVRSEERQGSPLVSFRSSPGGAAARLRERQGSTPTALGGALAAEEQYTSGISPTLPPQPADADASGMLLFPGSSSKDDSLPTSPLFNRNPSGSPPLLGVLEGAGMSDSPHLQGSAPGKLFLDGA